MAPLSPLLPPTIIPEFLSRLICLKFQSLPQSKVHGLYSSQPLLDDQPRALSKVIPTIGSEMVNLGKHAQASILNNMC